MRKGVIIEKINLLGSNSSGKTFEFNCNRQGDFLLAYRVAGSISGRHYHTGKSPQKNPEILILVSGRARLKIIDLSTGSEEEMRLEAPCRVEIYPHIWHELEALEDISFIELNSPGQHASDTFYEIPDSLGIASQGL